MLFDVGIVSKGLSPDAGTFVAESHTLVANNEFLNTRD
jgi:hypothetical protein